MKLHIGSAVIAFLVTSKALAQEPFSVRCFFREGVYASYAREKVKVEKSAAGDLQPLIFEEIDFSNSTTRGTGNVSSSMISAFEGEDSANLLEVTQSGNFMLTTIFNISRLLRGLTAPAVHSRHPIALGKGLPSQYYGFCISI